MDRCRIFEMVGELIDERENVRLLCKHYQITPAHLQPIMLNNELISFLNEQDLTPSWKKYTQVYYLSKTDGSFMYTWNSWKVGCPSSIDRININVIDENIRSIIFKNMVHSLQEWYSLQQKIDTWIADNSVYFIRYTGSETNQKIHIHFRPHFDDSDPKRIRESLQYLLSRGFDINSRNKNRHTLLYDFLLDRKINSSIHHVLNMKADPNIICGNTNQTCFDMACISSYQETIIPLIDHGAIIQQSNINTFIARGQSHVLRKCMNMGFDIYWPVDRFIKWNSNRYNHNILQSLNKSIDRTSIATIKTLLKRNERQFYMQVDSLWGVILHFIYPDKKRKI